MVKIYYDKVKHLEIEDISGKKTLTQIKKEFGDADYEMIEIDRTKGEAQTTRNGKLEKYSLEEERQQAEAEAETKRQLRENKLKAKLNLTDEQIDILRDAIREGI